ncbi:TnsD family Tn7-like transposition protein [Geomonas ferrireducens]|uniref:TnsD family Tn7-like transposition protein n=1 Tax=Geomonas ferrireducens TaxID=2570227 RepID=UPI0010A7E8F4|nr:TnsD family Tn7-like transposition protein [Geomonas ferrireducens]
MFTYLPEPYEDELLFSVVARHLAYRGSRNTINIISSLFGRKWEHNVGLPRGLSIVAEQTWPLWQMTGRDIAIGLTMYPFYVAFLPPDEKDRVMEAILYRSRSEPVMYLTTLMPKTLRICLKCRAEDLQSKQETYWRRSHQIKGIVLCPMHGEELVNSGVQRDHKLGHFTDATDAINAVGEPTLQLNFQERKQAWALARRCQMILNGRLEKQWGGATPSLYKKIAIEKGFFQDRSSDLEKFVKAFQKMYSIQLMATTELPQTSPTALWLKRILNPHQPYVFQPIAHAVLQEFLLNVPQQAVSTELYGNGPWKCPNPFSKHNDPLPIKKIKMVRDGRTGRPIAQGRCCCGFYFSFFGTEKADASMPIVHRIQQHGPTWKREINRLRNAGFTVTRVCKQLNINVRVFYSIQRGTKFQEHLQSLRKQWQDILVHTESKNITEARRQNPHLYRQLKRRDPCFVYLSTKRKPFSHKKRNMAGYWKNRDTVLSSQLRTKVREIMELKPPVRAAATTILSKCDFLMIFNIHRRNLPICEKTLKDVAETADAFQKRRLKYVLERSNNEDKSLTKSQLFQKAGIRRKEDKQRLESYINSLQSTQRKQK